MGDNSLLGRSVFVGALALVQCTGLREGPALDAGDEAGSEADSSPGADGGGGGDATKTRFCSTLAPPADFCADFDDGTLEQGFENALANPDPGVAGGGQIFLDMDLANSYDGTRAIGFSVPSLIATTTRAQAYLVKQVPITPTDLIRVRRSANRDGADPKQRRSSERRKRHPLQRSMGPCPNARLRWGDLRRA